MTNTMTNIEETVKKSGIIPVVKIEDYKDACDLAKAVSDGGLKIIEITYRTKAAGRSIALIKNEFPDFIVAAGTVLSEKDVDDAVCNGADFIVAPGFNQKVLKECTKKNIQLVPGVATPTEVDQAFCSGLKTLKFFPAEVMGGPAMLKALSGPYPECNFVPTGGISEANLASYLSLKNVIAAGGTWMVKSQLIAEHKWNEIRELTAKAVEIVASVRK